MLNPLKSRFWKAAAKKAEELSKDNDRLHNLAEQTTEKFEGSKSKLESIKEDLLLSVELIKDLARGRYRDIGVRAVLVLVAGFLYFLNPMDLIPDFILGTGFLDDVTVLGFVFNEIKTELDKYRNFKSAQSEEKSDSDPSQTHQDE